MASKMTSKPEECDICLEMFNCSDKRPRVFPCGHTFCSHCIENLLQNDSVICPNCRAQHRASNVDNFPVVFILEEFIKKRNPRNERLAAGQPPWKRLGKKIAEVREEQEASFRNFRIGYKAKYSQLDDYATSLFVWECQHRELNAELRDVIEKQEIIKLKLEEEKRLVKELQHEGREQQRQLDAAGELIDTARTMQELITVVDEAEQARAVSENWIQRCNEMFPNVSAIQKSVEARAAIKEALDVIRRGMACEVTPYRNAALASGNGASAHKAMADHSLSIPEKVKCIISNLSSKLTVDRVLQKDGPAKAFLDAGEAFAVQKHRSVRISRINNEVYVHHLKDVRPPASAHTIPFQEMATSFDLSSTLAFLELVWQDSPPRRVQIRLCRYNWLAKQFLMMCTGEKGPSYANTGMISDGYRGYSQECIQGGNYDGRKGKVIISPDDNPIPKVPERAGIVKQHGHGNSTQFSIVIGAGRANTEVDKVFGYVENGLEVLMSAAKAQYEKKASVVIVDCGAVIPL
ncbi:uncharacterized protein LOC125044087 isoform X2 [Penaeus chinensis]|uniref:uncharacterized protein LOC125044087 isoform X2 n=1 Tax=Penaeus chinensis TaxID=139456 RepID=UPI001FB83639|nr:uncharacterized protein LOC125044087 isoform X2 [Penaeus chinensis]XP_047496512.1 uncharacterized protein LOC125044087 isoform X2 [Penaeus chinensis]